jgi:hypothetical protein
VVYIVVSSQLGSKWFVIANPARDKKHVLTTYVHGMMLVTKTR